MPKQTLRGPSHVCRKKPSKNLSLIGVSLFAPIVFGWVIYLLAFSPAKSWDVRILAECTTSLNDKKMARDILNQVSENTRKGKIDRLNSKCSSIREAERLADANAFIAYAKSSVKNS